MAKNGRKEGKSEGLLERVGEIFKGDDEQDEDAPKGTDLLKEDHDRVRELFKRYDKLGERAYSEKQSIVEEVSRELEIHAQIEEEIFYPACLRGEKEATKMVRESFEEHKIVKTLIAELAVLTSRDEQFEAKVTVLKENVEHHADEEEDDLFPEAEDILGDDGLRRVGAEMKSLKAQLQGRGAGTRRSVSAGKTRAARAARPAGSARRGGATRRASRSRSR